GNFFQNRIRGINHANSLTSHCYPWSRPSIFQIGRDFSSMDRQQEYVLRTLEDRDVRFIRLWFTDVVGALKSVALAPAEVEYAFSEGLGFDGSSIDGFTRIFESDMLLQPDPTTFQILPWRGDEEQT